MESFALAVTGDNVPAGEYDFCLNLTNSTLLKMEDSGRLQRDQLGCEVYRGLQVCYEGNEVKLSLA